MNPLAFAAERGEERPAPGVRRAYSQAVGGPEPTVPQKPHSQLFVLGTKFGKLKAKKTALAHPEEHRAVLQERAPSPPAATAAAQEERGEEPPSPQYGTPQGVPRLDRQEQPHYVPPSPPPQPPGLELRPNRGCQAPGAQLRDPKNPFAVRKDAPGKDTSSAYSGRGGRGYRPR